MAGIKVIKQAVQICREAGVTPFIWGHRGMGKSSLVRQLAEERGWGFVDVRFELEAVDLRGLPHRGEDGRLTGCRRPTCRLATCRPKR